MSARIRLGVSSCLIGERVRYDGGHKRDAYVVETLGKHFELVPFCPEVAIGLGVPRPPIRLVRAGRGVHARGVEDPALDVTARLAGYAARVAPKLARVSGYILKSRSPSCGLQGVPVHDARGKPVARGAGVYAGTLARLLPELPFEEEDGLADPERRANFLERVFVYHRWQRLVARRLTTRRFAEFHARHALTVLAHDERALAALGRLVAGKGSIAARGARYIRLLMRTLEKPATRTRHAGVLRRMAGLLKPDLDAGARRELAALIIRYRRGELSRSAPLALLRRYARRFPNHGLAGQYYLAPPPGEPVLDALD